MTSYEELEKRLDGLGPHPRGATFERLVKHYLTRLPGRFDQVWLWEEWPQCDGPDAGIDLVAKARVTTAVQAKALGQGRQLTKTDLNSFIVEAKRREFAQLLVVTTASSASRNARKLIEDYAIEVHYRNALQSAQIQWPDSLPPSRPRWWRFQKAREFARGLRLGRHEDWLRYSASGKRPAQVPANPQVTYGKDGSWTNWGDFLGTGNQRRKSWRAFDDARDFARRLGLESERAWRRFVKTSERPPDIPTNPSRVYSSQWRGWPDWLGTQPRRQHWKSYKLAARFARSLGLASAKDWAAHVQSNPLPPGVPRSPQTVYRSRGWTSWAKFLGSRNIAPQKRGRMPYDEAATLVRRIGISSSTEFRRYCRSGDKPDDLPANPDRAYAGSGWTSWGLFLGTNRRASTDHQWLPYQNARRLVRNLGITSRTEWRARAQSGQLPPGVPRCPDEVYRDSGWGGWSDWLGNESGNSRGA